MKFPAIYGILVGIMMFTQWMFFLANEQVPELQTEPWRIATHLAAELITAAGLIISSWGLLQRKEWSTKAFLFFAGMLVYSVIVSPGYFAQQGQWALVAMFAILLALAIICVIIITRLLKNQESNHEP